jgi:hypothetical protein
MGALQRRLRRGAADEGGFAMVTAVLAIVVASLLGIVIMNLSFHTAEASAFERSRTQSVHAAEAGLDVVLASFEDWSTGELPCTVSGTMTAEPVATWSVDITYYPAYPLIDAPLACVDGYLPATSEPGGARLLANGSVTNYPTGTVERFMEMNVSMSPIMGAFNKAIFSDQAPIISNNVTVYGENGNDADVYTNGSWTCSNSLMVYGSIYAQGSASMSNTCRAAVDLWANGSVTMSNQARIDHDVKSSTGSLTMSQSASVGNNAIVGTTCTGCTAGSNVGGTITTGNVQPPPPVTVFPDMVFDATAWQDAGFTVNSYTDCTTARSWLTNAANAGTKAVIRITGGCTLDIANNTTINRSAALGIFTDGEITMNNRSTWRSTSSSWHDLFLIVESGASCAGTDGRITMSNLTSFEHLYFFVYSPCRSTFNNNNSSGRGQIYGEVVAGTNQLTFTFHSMLVPGAGEITGYTAGTAFIREID